MNSGGARGPSREILALAVEQSPNSILITDLGGRIEYVNARFTATSQYTPAEVLGRSASILKSGRMPTEVYRTLWSAIKAGQTWRGELCNRRKDGTLYWDEVVISPVKDSSGRVTHYLSIQTDITARKEIAERLRESEARVRAIVEAAAEGILTFDGQGRIQSFNPAAERIFGYAAREVLGRGIERLIPPERPDAAAQEAGAPPLRPGLGKERQGRRKDGRAVPLELAVSEFHDGVGRYYAAVVRDISRRKHMEAALREERNFVSAVLATTAALIVVLDSQGRIVRLNKACEALLGCESQTVRGEVFWERFLPPEERSTLRSAFESPRGGHFPTRFEGLLVASDGSQRIVVWNNTALVGGPGERDYVIATGIDVTERRHAEERARAHEVVLAHMDRLNLMGAMGAGLAHELNQPLTSIYAYAQAALRMLKGGELRSERFQHAVTQVAKLAEQAGEIVRRLRDFVRRRELKSERVDIVGVIEEAMEFVKPEIRRYETTLELGLPHALPPVAGDAVQIEQVLINLIRNALEAMAGEERRVVTVCAERVEDGFVQISVHDTGPGLPPEQVPQVFEAFRTTKEEGMGMGLAISRSVIEALGGRLWVEARGQTGGATFRFTLPVADV